MGCISAPCAKGSSACALFCLWGSHLVAEMYARCQRACLVRVRNVGVLCMLALEGGPREGGAGGGVKEGPKEGEGEREREGGREEEGESEGEREGGREGGRLEGREGGSLRARERERETERKRKRERERKRESERERERERAREGAQGLFASLDPAKLVPMDDYGPMYEALYTGRSVAAPSPRPGRRGTLVLTLPRSLSPPADGSRAVAAHVCRAAGALGGLSP